jgi:hypothetical protein
MVVRKTITTKVAEIIKEDGFLRIKFFETENLFDLAEAKMKFDAAFALCGGEPYKVLIDVRGVNVSPDRDAQDFLRQLDYKKADAIIVSNLAVRILSEFYRKRSTKNKVKIFSREDKAIEWLLKQ